MVSSLAENESSSARPEQNMLPHAFLGRRWGGVRDRCIVGKVEGNSEQEKKRRRREGEPEFIISAVAAL